MPLNDNRGEHPLGKQQQVIMKSFILALATLPLLVSLAGCVPPPGRDPYWSEREHSQEERREEAERRHREEMREAEIRHEQQERREIEIRREEEERQRHEHDIRERERHEHRDDERERRDDERR